MTTDRRAEGEAVAEALRRTCGYENVTPTVRRYRSSASNGLVLDAADEIERLSRQLAEAQAEQGRLAEILNTPVVEPFLEGAIAEAKHQRFRWGDEHDATKTAWDWFWTLGFLGSKAAHAALIADWPKAKHHTITAAAMLANWHRHICACAASPTPPAPGVTEEIERILVTCLSGLDTWPQNTVPRSVPSAPPFSPFRAKFRTPKAD